MQLNCYSEPLCYFTRHIMNFNVNLKSNFSDCYSD